MARKTDNENPSRSLSKLQIAGLAVLCAAVLLLVVSLVSANSGHVLNFELTDPPQVPVGTQSLIIGYSSVRAHLSGPDNGTWITGTGSGSVNLVGLVNSSTLIGSVVIPANSSIDEVSFLVTYADITINGTTYNVTVPNDQITAQVSATRIDNGSVLIDLSPTIVTLVTDNSTIFVMVPSIRAVFVGSRKLVNPRNIRQFQEASNLTISSESLSSFGNNMSLSVTLFNNGNRSVDLRDVFLYGNFSVLLVPSLDMGGKTYLNTGVAVHQGVGTIVSDGRIQIEENGSTNLNSPGMINLIHIGGFLGRIGVVGFIVNSNGNLVAPYSGAMYGGGYSLAPGGSVTLSFAGQMSFDNGHIVIFPEMGTDYKVVVIGDGVYAYTNAVDG